MAQITANDEILNTGRESDAPNMPPPFRPSVSLPVMPSPLPVAITPAVQHPYIHIVEEPTDNVIRFRYKCEGRTAGSIPGKNSKPEMKTFPTIEIVNFDGPVVVVVSLVTHEKPYRQHPHWLVSKEEVENCKIGVYRKQLPPHERRLELQKVGIQCVKKSDARESLLAREQINVDPFNAKFDHKDNINGINLYALRLCYQAFLKVGSNKIPLDPVVSEPIFGKSNELTINRICSCSSKLSGGDRIIMLCEKINKDDIKIRFFETNEVGEEVWHDFAEFQATDVYKQVAIAFRTPRYRNTDLTHSVQVSIRLERPSDNATSASVPFEYYPNPGNLTQHYRSEAHKATESVKRKLAHIKHQNPKQYKKLLSPQHQQQQQQEQQQQQPLLQAQPQFVTHMSSYNGQSPSPTGTGTGTVNYVPEIKTEQYHYDMDMSRNCPSAASSYNNYNFPASPSSSCSTVDSIAPVTRMQSLHPLQQQMMQSPNQHEQINYTLSINSNRNGTWYTTTNFNGGDMTPINNSFINGNINGNGINNNNIFNMDMNQSSTPLATNIMEAPSIATYATNTAELRQQLPEASAMDDLSFSDLIRNVPSVDYDDDLMHDLDATLGNLDMAKLLNLN